MKQFKYKVISQDGKSSSGVLEAVDLRQAAGTLKAKNLLIAELHEEMDSTLSTTFASFNKPKADEVANFTRQLATMINSGLPLVDALKILKNQSNKSMKQSVEKVLTEVEGGSTLADAMMQMPEVFTNVYVALVRAGETAGVLDRVLAKLADNLDKQREFRSKTKGALVYPFIVLSGMIIIAIVMMIFVVPKLTEMYKDFGAELPTPTKILMGVSDFVVRFWYITGLAVGAAVYGMKKWMKTEVGALIVEQTILKVPILGPLKKDIILTEFARTMSVLLSAGISVLDGLGIVADTLGSRIIGAEVRQTANLVEKGVSLSVAIARSENFPPILGQMISVGEETGKLDEVLGKLANFYESESEIKVKSLTTAVEPLIMIMMGIGVGFLVIAVIMPIYNLTSQF